MVAKVFGPRSLSNTCWVAKVGVRQTTLFWLLKTSGWDRTGFVWVRCGPCERASVCMCSHRHTHTHTGSSQFPAKTSWKNEQTFTEKVFLLYFQIPRNWGGYKQAAEMEMHLPSSKNDGREMQMLNPKTNKSSHKRRHLQTLVRPRDAVPSSWQDQSHKNFQAPLSSLLPLCTPSLEASETEFAK